MRLIQLRNSRKKLLFVIFVLIVTVALLNYENNPTKHVSIAYDESEHWDMEEWFEIKNQYNSLLENQTETNITNRKLDYCQNIPSRGKKKIKIFKYPVNFNARSDVVYNYNIGNYRQTTSSRWTPNNCRSRHRVAILIPYKNREDNLNYFLTHMHPFLQRQELEYQIFVVEQSRNQPFNKGVLMNAGFLEIMALKVNQTSDKNISFNFDCVVFHDVDLLPEDDRIMYSCPYYKPRHLSVAIDKYGYRMAYSRLIGGVLNFKSSHFLQVNGYSNQYWGWGAEDDDMEIRLSRIAKIGYERPNINIAHYRMLKHSARFKNPLREKLLRAAKTRHNRDGVNTVEYKLVDLIHYKLFTHILIDVGEPPKYIQDILHPPSPSPSINVKINNTTLNPEVSSHASSKTDKTMMVNSTMNSELSVDATS